MPAPYVLILVLMIASWMVQQRLRSKFQQYSLERLRANLSGAEIAERMLADHNIYDVRVISTEGQLTDHYDPST